MTPRKPRVLTSRKILVASVGVASVSYACGGTFSSDDPGPSRGAAPVQNAGGQAGAANGGFTSGNLMPPSGGAGGTVVTLTGGFTSGNLLPPPSGGTGGRVVTLTGGFTSGNLLPPPPPPSTGGQPSQDAGTDATKPLPTSGNLVPPPPIPSI